MVTRDDLRPVSGDGGNEPPPATPAAEVEIDPELVRALLRHQHPDLAHLDLEPLDAGWDNALFRLGDALCVRLPRRQLAAALIEHEQRWLPYLAPRLPLPIPAPQRTGRPGSGYPWCWSVLPWLPGAPADLEPPAPDQAQVLADFLRALHQAAPRQAPSNPFRGVPLAQRQDVVEARLGRLAARTPDVTERVVAAWQAALSAPEARQACWVHGDLHARNVLVTAGSITGVIDWGDVCRGDPATDLAAVWMLLEPADARCEAMRRYGNAAAGTWRRALGWAVSFGTVLLETGLADHARHARMGRDILRRIDEGPDVAELR